MIHQRSHFAFCWLQRLLERSRQQKEIAVGKRSSRTRRTSRRKENAALQLLAVGTAIALVPLFLSGNSFVAMLKPIAPLGWLMAGAGGLLLWLQSRKADSNKGTSSHGRKLDKPLPPLPDMPPINKGPEAPAATAQPARPAEWGPAVFEIIEWRRFEALVEALFAQAGFQTRSQSHGADGGVDIWVHSQHKPDAPVTIVQCKHWQGKRVGVDKIRELRGVMAAHGIARGQFATTSRFTEEAIAFAKDNSINLLDVDGLLSLIKSRSAEHQQALLNVALEGEYWRPTCANCGVKLVARQPKQGGKPFWGCAGYPACCTTMVMSSAAAACAGVAGASAI